MTFVSHHSSRIRIIAALLLIPLCGLNSRTARKKNVGEASSPRIVILGIAQDAGYPQAGCSKGCCMRTREHPETKRYVTSLGLTDPNNGERWIFDATPDFPEQLYQLEKTYPQKEGQPVLNGIFLTHAHIGHYTGLMHLGREVMGTRDISVYAMPRMHKFLTENGPWSQLVSLHNIALQTLADSVTIHLNDRLAVTPFTVPHRDEYSETVGYKISGPSRSLIYIPDIDKWEKWKNKITDVIHTNDYILIDGTFFSEEELNGRRMSEVPHPFVNESMLLFTNLSKLDKAKIHFIHFNHTNPVLINGSEAYKKVTNAGFHIADQMETFEL